MTEPVALTAYAQNTSHVAQALAQLAGQFHGKPKIEGLLQSWMLEVQAVENALWQVLLSGNVASAVASAFSDALDKLGEIVGVARQGLIDAQFNFALDGAVLANNSKASSDDLHAVLLGIEGLSAIITEGYPAAVLVDPTASIVHVPASTQVALLKRAKPAGVRLNLLEYPIGDTFEFSSTRFTETDAAHGWSDTTFAPGGKLVGVLE